MLSRAALSIYLGTFLALVAAGVGFPIPEEVPIIAAGAYVGHVYEGVDPAWQADFLRVLNVAPLAGWPGTVPWAGLYLCSPTPNPGPSPAPVRWWIMLPVCILGVVISDGLLYGMGRIFGRRLLDLPLMARLLPPEKLQRIETNFHRYGVLVLLFARFLPTIRSPIFITAGIMRLSFARFLLADGIYAIPGVSLLFFLAFWFGHHVTDLIVRAESKVERLRPLIFLLLIAGVAGYLIAHFFRHPVATGDPREEVPLVGERVAEKMEHPSRKDEPKPDGRTA